ncbi:MAG: trehalose-phosphatase [Pseudomonadota bacterium]|nr:trehalose-phosphatase [Pseudomonadota bacterium]
MKPSSPRPERHIDTLPNALAELDRLTARLAGQHLAIFLDYDGTLTPICADPAQAMLGEAMRARIAALASRACLAVISGRDTADVQAKVGLPELYYAGSHGLEIRGPDGFHEERAQDYLPALATARQRLMQALTGVDGVLVEPKRYAIAVHYRAAPEARERVHRCVEQIAAAEPRLRTSHGKKIIEIRPALDWHKGRAVEYLRGELPLPDGHIALYIGDDLTDEDAFAALGPADLGLIVADGEDNDRTSFADYRLPDVAGVGQMLEAIERTAAPAP